jgi:hypothetical protein
VDAEETPTAWHRRMSLASLERGRAERRFTRRLPWMLDGLTHAVLAASTAEQLPPLVEYAVAGEPVGAPAAPHHGEHRRDEAPTDGQRDQHRDALAEMVWNGPLGEVLIAAPTVESATGALTLYDWLRNHTRDDGVWATVVAEMYADCSTDPEVAGYFGGVDLSPYGDLQRHFLAALVLLTSRGLTRATVQRIAVAHVNVRNQHGEVITPAVFDKVLLTLAGLLQRRGVPSFTVGQLAELAQPLRRVILDPPKRPECIAVTPVVQP